MSQKWKMTPRDRKGVQRGLKPDRTPTQGSQMGISGNSVKDKGLETSLQHTYKSLALETSYVQCKSKHIKEAGQETRGGGWYD